MIVEEILEAEAKAFVGREEAIRELDALLDRYAEGKRKVVINIYGPEACGKTKLINYFIRTRLQMFGYIYSRADARVHKSWLLLLKRLRDYLQKEGIQTQTFDAYLTELKRKLLEARMGTNTPAIVSGLFLPNTYLTDSVYRQYMSVKKAYPEYFNEFSEDVEEASPYWIARFAPLALAVDISSEARRLKEPIIIVLDHVDEVDDIAPILAFTIAIQSAMVILVSREKLNIPGQNDVVYIELEHLSEKDLSEIARELKVEPAPLSELAKKILETRKDETAKALFTLPYVPVEVVGKERELFPLLEVVDESGAVSTYVKERQKPPLEIKEIARHTEFPELEFLVLLHNNKEEAIKWAKERVTVAEEKGDVIHILRLYSVAKEILEPEEILKLFSIAAEIADGPKKVLGLLDAVSKKDVGARKFLEALVSAMKALVYDQKVWTLLQRALGYLEVKEQELYPLLAEAVSVALSAANLTHKFNEIAKLEEALEVLWKRARAPRVKKEIKESVSELRKEAQLKLARAYLVLGKKDKAKKLLGNLSGPESKLLSLALGEVVELGDEEFEGYDELIRLPRVALANYFRASWFEGDTKLKLLDSAVSTIKELLEKANWQYLDPILLMGKAVRERAAVLVALGRIKEAVSSTDSAIKTHKLARDYTHGILAEVYEELLESFLEHIKLLEEHGKESELAKSISELLTIAEEAFSKLKEGELKARRVTERELLDVIAKSFVEMSEVLARLGYIKEALSKAERAVEIYVEMKAPEQAVIPAKINLAKMKMRLGDYHSAEELLKGIEQEEATLWLLESLRRQNKLPQEAELVLSSYEKSKEIWKPLFAYYMAELYIEEDEGEKAETILNEVVEADISWLKDWPYFKSRMFVARGKLKERQRDARAAIRDYEEARNLIRRYEEGTSDTLYLSSLAHIYYSIGKAALKIRELDRAISELRKATELAIKVLKLTDWKDFYTLGIFTIAHVNLARVYLRKGKLEEAAISVEEALRQGKVLIELAKNPRSYIYYLNALEEGCRLYIRRKDTDKLKETFKEYVKALMEEEELQAWKDSAAIERFLNVVEEVRRGASEELVEIIVDCLKVIVERLQDVLIGEDLGKKLPRLLLAYGRAATVLADLLWKRASFNKAYATIDIATSLLKHKLNEIESDDDKLRIKVHIFNMLVMKSTMKYFAEGDVETMMQNLPTCEAIAKEFAEKEPDSPEAARMICDVHIMRVRIAVFLKDHNKALTEAKEILSLIRKMKEASPGRAARYAKILLKIINYALAGRDLPKEIVDEYRAIRRELNEYLRR